MSTSNVTPSPAPAAATPTDAIDQTATTDIQESDPLADQVNAMVAVASTGDVGQPAVIDPNNPTAQQPAQQGGITPEALVGALQSIVQSQAPQQNEALNTVLNTLAQGQNALSETIARISAPATPETVDPLAQPIDSSAVIRGLSAEQQKILKDSDGLAELVVTLADNVSKERLGAMNLNQASAAPVEDNQIIKALQAEVATLRGSSFSNTLQAVNPDAYAKMMSPAGQAFMAKQNSFSSSHTNQRFFDMQAGNNDVQGAINLLAQIPDEDPAAQSALPRSNNVTAFPLNNQRQAPASTGIQVTPQMMQRLQDEVSSGQRPYSDLENVEKMLARQQG